MHRPIVYGNTAVLLSAGDQGGLGHTHQWTVGVYSATSEPPAIGETLIPIGGADDLSYFIKKVTFKLHDTYPQSTRSALIDMRGLTRTAIDRPPFEVTETGWGEFDIIIRIFFAPESGEKPLQLIHHLKLHPWPAQSFTGPTNILPLEPEPIDFTKKPPPEAPKIAPAPAPVVVAPLDPSAAPTPAPAPAEPVASTSATQDSFAPAVDPSLKPPTVSLSPVYSYQYDEIVFIDPTEQFYQLMAQYPPSPLPPANRRAQPEGAPPHPISINGNIGELSVETETQEMRRLDRATLQALVEIDKMRTRMSDLTKAMEAAKARDAAAALTGA